MKWQSTDSKDFYRHVTMSFFIFTEYRCTIKPAEAEEWIYHYTLPLLINLPQDVTSSIDIPSRAKGGKFTMC